MWIFPIIIEPKPRLYCNTLKLPTPGTPSPPFFRFTFCLVEEITCFAGYNKEGGGGTERGTMYARLFLARKEREKDWDGWMEGVGNGYGYGYG